MASAALLAALVLAAAPARSEDAAVGAPVAADAAAGQVPAEPKPFVDTVCPLMQQQADAMGLPPMLFVRLIWKESRFDPQAVSPKGAQGIAQFMPATAADRGLDDPSSRKRRSSIPRACSPICVTSSAISVSRRRPICRRRAGAGLG
jgi:soluble lytic murein transglycosylase-like protein